MSEREEWESGPPEDKSERLQGIRHLNEPNCFHDWVPTFQGRDTYRCKKCGKEIDMTEDDDF
jgi:tRNA(Ile2) C34 agmatinyltransferase TiaS